jgi:hypothetical protein
MLLLLFITLVWLKIVAGDTLIFFWLWLARDRGLKGFASLANHGAVMLFWLLPWLAFLWHEASLYAGHCGLRQGLHACGLVEFLWSELDWVRLGLLLDLTLFAGILVLMTRVRVAKNDEPPLAQPDGSPP